MGLVCSLWVWFATVSVLAVGLEFLSVGLFFFFFVVMAFAFSLDLPQTHDGGVGFDLG